MISAIVAHGPKREIGRGNELLLHLPGDLKRFRELTTGHTVLMGRKTWESLPRRPLPGRTNLVLTAQNAERVGAEGAHRVMSLEECRSWIVQNAVAESIFNIGGGQVYRELLDLCSTLYVSRFNQHFPDADAFFPPYESAFTLVEHTPCEGYDFQIFRRIGTIHGT